MRGAIERWLSRWTAPFGFDLTYRPLWRALCLGALIGTLVAYLFDLWMLRRGLFRWRAVAPLDGVAARGSTWYPQVVLVALSFPAVLGATLLSMRIAR
jgi:hypothetical protein